MSIHSFEQFVQHLCDHPDDALPEPLPYQPLDVLIGLHSHIVAFMNSNIPLAERIAQVSRHIADRMPHDALLDAQAHWSSGSAIFHKPAYVHSLRHYDAALAAYAQACEYYAPEQPPRDIRIVHITRLACLSELGRYDEAIKAADQASAWIKEHPDHTFAQLTLLLNQSHLSGKMGHYRMMANQSRKLAALAEQHQYTSIAIKSWINLGYAHMHLGELDQAEEALQHGAQLAEQEAVLVDLGRAQANRARIFQIRGQLFDALQGLRTAHSSMVQAEAEGELAFIDQERSQLYFRIGYQEAALEMAIQAVQAYQQQQMVDYSAHAALDAVSAALRWGAVHKAQLLLDSLALHRETLIAPLAARYQLLETLVKALTSHKNLTPLFKRAAQAMHTLEKSDLPHEAITTSLLLADIATQLGHATTVQAQQRYAQLCEIQEPHIQIAALHGASLFVEAKQSVQLLQRAAQLVIAQRRVLPSEELQARYSNQKSPIILQLVKTLIELNQLDDAYAALGELKAGALLDMRAASESQPSKLATDLEHLRWHMTELRKEAGIYREQARHADPADRAALLAHATGLDQRATKLLTQEIAFLGVAERSGQAQIPHMSQVAAVLPADTALIDYALFDDKHLIVFLIRLQQPLQVLQLPAEGLTQLLMRWRVSRGGLAYTPAGYAAEIQARMQPLWQLLIAPLLPFLQDATQLVIAPHSILHDIPWAMLYGNGSYLSDQFQLTLTPSGALWASPYAARPRSAPRIICYAGSNDNPTAPLLQYAEQEITAIQRALPKAEIIMPATRTDLQQTYAPSLLHLLAHGQTHPHVPLSSTLHFADGDLLLLEAHRLKLHGTQLAVLSGCETGIRPAYGDLVLAQAGAFLCAGARAVIASLWNVDDAATAELMAHFYAAYAAGQAAASALHHAQHAIRDAYPLHWAAFQLWEGAAPDACSSV